MIRQYTKLYGKEPVVETIHAGVECGIIADKLPGLDCISFGPDIIDIHTTKEKLSISSVERTWKLILSVLENINEVK
jgi:dipeptidase D